jgi:hypothetical protein
MKQIETEKTRECIKNAFVQLRKEGFIARQNFWCCQSCAGCDLANKVRVMNDKTKFKGSVFYTQQDNQRLNETGKVMLAFGDVSVDGVDFGMPTQEAGQKIASVLQDNKLVVNWNGTAGQRMEVWAEDEN